MHRGIYCFLNSRSQTALLRTTTKNIHLSAQPRTLGAASTDKDQHFGFLTACALHLFSDDGLKFILCYYY
jgi:hypothetical protein